MRMRFTLAGRVHVPLAVNVWIDRRKVTDCITVLIRRMWSSPADTASVESGLVGTRSPMPVPVSSPIVLSLTELPREVLAPPPPGHPAFPRMARAAGASTAPAASCASRSHRGRIVLVPEEVAVAILQCPLYRRGLAPFVNDRGIVHSMFLVARQRIHLVAPVSDQRAGIVVDPNGDACFFELLAEPPIFTHPALFILEPLHREPRLFKIVEHRCLDHHDAGADAPDLLESGRALAGNELAVLIQAEAGGLLRRVHLGGDVARDDGPLVSEQPR